jgi:endonuclease-3
LGNAFGKAEGFVVDTHVQRLSGRMGLSKAKEPAKIEQDLMRIFPRQSWIELGHRLILHGRQVCTAKRPACGKCSLSDDCPKVGVEGARP